MQAPLAEAGGPSVLVPTTTRRAALGYAIPLGLYALAFIAFVTGKGDSPLALILAAAALGALVILRWKRWSVLSVLSASVLAFDIVLIAFWASADMPWGTGLAAPITSSQVWWSLVALLFAQWVFTPVVLVGSLVSEWFGIRRMRAHGEQAHRAGAVR